MIGKAIGPYRVVDQLGEGGMGVVYRARDEKLGRDVALKVLPDLVSDDPDRLARFEREARVLASLNHPHIAQVFGFEHKDGVHAIAMELVDGQTLQEAISEKSGAIGEKSEVGSQKSEVFSWALPIARQIAEALEAAHDQGVVHRDLKPANVKVREDGTVKVLDFGLAKAMAADAEASSGPDAANSPTLTARATAAGMILGTAAYMAPEQAKGRHVDKRADVWAFGAVLFEMLTGQRAFEGEDVSETLASVLAREPNFDALSASTPEPVRRLIARCLEKDPRKRLRDIGDAMRRLDEDLARESAAPAAESAARPPAGTGARAWLVPAAVALAIGLVGGWWVRPDGPASAGDVVRFDYAPPSWASIALGQFTRAAALSPDGNRIVYRHDNPDGPRTLVSRQLGDTTPTVIAGTEDAFEPFFSPEGAWIGFGTEGDNVLRKVPASGGRAELVTAFPNTGMAGATWTSDDRIVFSSGNVLYQVAAAGGQPTVVTEPGPDALHRWPAAVPDSTLVIFTEADGAGGRALHVVDLETGAITPLGITGTSPRLVGRDRLLYATNDGAIWAVSFDAGRISTGGDPRRLVEDVWVNSVGAAQYAASTQALISMTGEMDRARSLMWVTLEGDALVLPTPPRAYVYAWISPDGRRLSLDIRDAERDIWLLDLERNTLERRSVTETDDEYGLWTPDGQQLVFSDQNNLYRIAANGATAPVALTTSDPDQRYRFPNAVTEDGHVIFRAPGVGGSDDLFTVPLDGGTPVPLLATEFDELNAAISPDGRWMAYQSDFSGIQEVYVRPYPDVETNRFQISSGGGTEPAWARDGSALFYLDGSENMMRAPVQSESAFSAGVGERLFDASRYFFDTVGRNYDVAADGRFIMVGPLNDADVPRQTIQVLLNWAALVRNDR